MEEAYFRAAYDADKANAARQDWGAYWSWVKAFYEGKRFPPIAGWVSREKELAAKLRPDAREKVLARLAEVGRTIAGEWAKDNAVRRISTDHLQGYGSQLAAAAKSDAGDGARILEVADVVESDVKQRTR